eukprot:scaffold84989_cov33-Phaeocystis_antarctica.AAC.1
MKEEKNPSARESRANSAETHCWARHREMSDIVVRHCEHLSSGSSVRTPLPRANSYASLEGNPRPCAELGAGRECGVAPAS